MKKVAMLVLLVSIFLVTNCFAGVMPVLLNCDFSVKGKVVEVKVFNYEELNDSYSTEYYQVTVIRHKESGSASISFHEKGSKYWEVPHMYDIEERDIKEISGKLPVREIILD